MRFSLIPNVRFNPQIRLQSEWKGTIMLIKWLILKSLSTFMRAKRRWIQDLIRFRHSAQSRGTIFRHPWNNGKSFDFFPCRIVAQSGVSANHRGRLATSTQTARRRHWSAARRSVRRSPRSSRTRPSPRPAVWRAGAAIRPRTSWAHTSAYCRRPPAHTDRSASTAQRTCTRINCIRFVSITITAVRPAYQTAKSTINPNIMPPQWRINTRIHATKRTYQNAPPPSFVPDGTAEPLAHWSPVHPTNSNCYFASTWFQNRNIHQIFCSSLFFLARFLLARSLRILSHFIKFSVSNGKYMEEMKYSTMHTVATLDEPKYANCHIEDHSIKTLQPTAPSAQYAPTTTNLTTVGGCHTDDGNDNNMTVVKSEDSNVTHSYILPPFLHWNRTGPYNAPPIACVRTPITTAMYRRNSTNRTKRQKNRLFFSFFFPREMKQTNYYVV